MAEDSGRTRIALGLDLVEEGRWLKIALGLCLAVGLRFPTADAPKELPGLAKYEPEAKQGQPPKQHPFVNFYWPVAGLDPTRIELLVPPDGEKAERCELRFAQREDDYNKYLLIFGRRGEPKPFTFKAEKLSPQKPGEKPKTQIDYIPLTLHPMEREGAHCRDLNPLYIKVGYPVFSDEGIVIKEGVSIKFPISPSIKFNFYVLNARWQKGVITITVKELAESDLGKIPDFLK